MLSGDPILMVILLAAVVLLVLAFVRPGRGLLLAAGIVVSLVPIIVLFVFGTVGDLADPTDADFLGALLFLVAIALALPAAVVGFRRAAVTPS